MYIYTYRRCTERAYLANANDTVRRLRRHASLLFWGGGNELWPAARSPGPPIARALAQLIAREDPGRFYIPSSMDGGRLGGNASERVHFIRTDARAQQSC